MKAKALIMFCLLSTAAAAQVKLAGDVPTPFGYPHLQKNLQMIWDFERETLLPGRELPAPEVYFYEFDRDRQPLEWTLWQSNWIRQNPSIWKDWTEIKGNKAPTVITAEWVDQNPNLFPFPKTFLAFHYDGTNRFQLSAERTFLQFYTLDPYGMRRDTVGLGYYSVAHEFMHYALEQRGIAGRLHHCLFNQPRPGGRPALMEEMAVFLIVNKISSGFVLKRGFEAERAFDSCKELNLDDRQLVNDLIQNL